MQEGDVVSFDYTLWIDGDKKPLDTSIEDVAKEHDFHNPQKHYVPLTVTIGRKQIIPGLDAHLLTLKEGDESTVVIPADEAYGERDVKKMKDVPMAQFRKQKVVPQVGMTLNFENERATVVRVAGGRVRLDMNHDLAGKDLKYTVKVTKAVTDIPGKVDAVCGYLFPMGGHKVEMDENAKRVVLELPDQAKFDPQFAQHKFRVLSELRSATDMDFDIVIQETYPANPPGYGPDEEE